MGIGLSREEKQEYTDAEVPKNYFGLTVEIRDTNEKRAEGKHPRRSDYVIGLAETDGFPLWSMSVEAGTNADLYYPKAGTSMGTIDGHVRDKAATQGGLVVLDMSESQQLQASYQAWVKASDEGSAHSWDQIDNFMSPFRVGTAPDRVIVIDHGDVVYDTYSYNMQWGPEPNLA